MTGRYGTLCPARRDIFLALAVWCILSLGILSCTSDIAHCLAGIFFSGGLVLMSLTDIRWGLLLDKANLLLFLGGLFFLVMEHAPFLPHFVGASMGGLGLLFLRMISRGGLGLGDVKFGIVLGLWLAPDRLYLALLFAFVMGGAFALLLLLFHRIRMDARLPFGPFLSAGAYLSFLYGTDILAWYGDLL